MVKDTHKLFSQKQSTFLEIHVGNERILKSLFPALLKLFKFKI